MKKSLVLLSLVILLFGCGGMKEVDISKKEEKNGIVYVENQKKPFTGKIISKYENGQIKMESQYKDGKLEGTVKEYYEDGQVHNEWNYKDNHLDGEQRKYYENGQLSTEKYYKDNKVEGIFKEYYEDGKIKSETEYKKGKKRWNL